MTVLRFVACGAFLFSVLGACAKAEPSGHLFAQDKEAPEEGDFNENAIITRDELQDSSVSAVTLRSFLTYRAVDKQRKNPYGRDSFLATYYSNGLSAVDALVNAAEQYKINPLVLLVRAQMEQGLIALDVYPVDAPARVEYVFGCGCAGPNACDPAFSGFDRQVDCLARQYKIILDEMDANGGVTTGGWAKQREAKTLDGKFVTPVDDGTAAAYQFDPRVGDSEHGNQLFWQIWKLYIRASLYQGPTGGSTTGAWIGDPCSSNEQCKPIGGGQGVCISNYPGGMCSMKCRDACSAREGRPESACIDTVTQGAFCFPRCNPNASSSCRGGSTEWACCAANLYPPVGVSQPVCRPVGAGQVGCGTQ